MTKDDSNLFGMIFSGFYLISFYLDKSDQNNIPLQCCYSAATVLLKCVNFV